MKLVLTATGPQGSGKTTLLSDLTTFLQRYPMLTETEVRIYEGDGRTFSDNASTFTVAASPSGRKEARESGDRETYAMFKAEDGNWYVSRGNANQAAFLHQDAARDFMRYESAPAARQAACDAILDGNNIVFDGARHYFTGGTVAKGGGGDFKDWITTPFDVKISEGKPAIDWLSGEADVASQIETIERECRDAGYDPAVIRKMAKDRRDKLSAAEAPAIHDLEGPSLKDLCNQPLGEPYKSIAESLGTITAVDIERYDSDRELEEMMTTYSEQLADSVRSIIRDKTTGGHTKTKLRHVLNFLDKLTNSDVAIPCDFDDHERNHALHLADRLQEFVMANRASVTVNEGVKFDQTIEYLNRIAKGAGVILDEDGEDPVYAAARALYDAGYWTLANKWDDGADPDEAKLWAALRDALKIPTGTETRRMAEKIAKNSMFGKLNPNCAYGKFAEEIRFDGCMAPEKADLFARYNRMDVYHFTNSDELDDLPTGYPEEMGPEEMDLSVKIKTIRPPFMFAGLEWSEYESGDEYTISEGDEPAAWGYCLAPDYGRYCAIILGQIADALSIPREMLEEQK